MLAKCFFIVVLAVGLFSCTNDVSDEESVFDYEEFQKQKAMWQELGINHYEFSGYTHKSDGSYDVTVTVFPDKEPVVFFRDEVYDDFKNQLDNIQPWLRTNPFYYYKGRTIDELYVSVEKEIKNLSNDFEFPLVFIQYDEKYHFPVKFYRWRHEEPLPKPEPGGPPVIPLGGGYPMLVIDYFEDLRKR